MSSDGLLVRTSARSNSSHVQLQSGTGSEHSSAYSRKQKKVVLQDDEFMAAAIGDLEWLKHALKKKSTGKIELDKNGFSSLHLAALHGRLSCVQFLIEQRKVPIDLPSEPHKWTPLHLSINHETSERGYRCMIFLIQNGANLTATNADLMTPLHQAASEGHTEAVRLLLELRVPLEPRDCRGNTPLDLAKLWNHRASAKLLVLGLWRQDKREQAEDLSHLRSLALLGAVNALERLQKRLVAKLDPNATQSSADRKLLETLDKNEETLFLARDQLKRPPPSRIGPTALAPPDATSKPRQTAKPAGAAPVSASSITEKDEGNFKRNESASVEEEQPAQTTMWNPSTKVAPTFWPRDPVLRDCYPRDPYTHMPYPDSTPLALNVRAGDPAAVLQRENQSLNDPSLPPIEPERPIQKGARDLFSTEQKRKARADCYKGQAEEREREKRRTKAIEEAEAVVREKRLPLVPKVASQELLSRLERSVVAGDGVREHLPEVSSSDVRSLRRELKLSANLEGRRVGRAVAHDAFAAALGAHVADSYSGAYAQGVRGDRPAVFRCHHVLDVQRRRHTRPNSSLPDRGADAAIVLCNDPTSQLFRLALLEGVNTNPKPEPNAETEKID